jgi:hypothetical protein
MSATPLHGELIAACIRCEERPAIDELGYCGRCHWISLLEASQGFEDLAVYLAKWAAFAVWCERHGRVPATG